MTLIQKSLVPDGIQFYFEQAYAPWKRGIINCKNNKNHFKKETNPGHANNESLYYFGHRD